MGITVSDSLNEGSLYIKPCFLSEEEFLEFESRIKNYSYVDTYQPIGTVYGNRFQSYPCWETNDLAKVDAEFYELFKKKLEHILGSNILLNMRIRKVLTEEIKRSKVNTKYGHVHADHVEAQYAGVYYFVQSFDGGTAMFETPSDKVPDIEVSAYRNRLVLYSGQRWHSPCTDFTFDERYVAVLFATNAH